MKLSGFKKNSTLLFPCLFTIAVFFALSKANLPPISKFPWENLKPLILEENGPFPPFGVQFSPLENMLPPDQTVSFIMDYPFSPYGRTIDQIYTAQAALVPRILDPLGNQPAAIIFCADAATADKRLKETGYRLIFPFANGKGIAVKS